MSTAANELPLSVVVNVSVASPQLGASEYNTSNLALFSRDPYATSFGTGSYKIYLSPSQVATDFGSSSNTYQMALAVFSQQPNILNNQGYLVIIPFLSAAQDQQVSITFPGVAVSGDWVVVYNGAANNSGQIAYGATASTVQTDVRTITALSAATVSGSAAAGFALNTEVSGVGYPVIAASIYTYTVTSASATQGATYTDAAGNVLTVLSTIASQTTLVTYGSGTPSASGTLTKTSGTGDSTITFSVVTTMVDANSKVVNPVVTVVVPGSTNETLDQAILRTQNQVQYFGVMASEIFPNTPYLYAAAALIQTLNKIAFFTSYTAVDAETGGALAGLATGGYKQSRAVPYFETTVANQPTTSLEYMAAYAGLGLSTNFGGSLTTQTMNLKGLNTIQPDPGLTTTLYESCQSTGCDVYASIQGIPKVLTSGANDFYDNQYNLQWFAGALEVAYFNALATTNTKVPQTEQGMNTIKSALRQVCQQAVSNGFLAPGTWNSPDTFGNPADLISNVAQIGYYIYSSPISQQLQSVRAQRIAPLCQIAAKSAGAVQSGNVLVFFNV